MSARIRSTVGGISPINQASRDDLADGSVVVVSSLDVATTYAWTIAYKPAGSNAAFSGSSSASSPGNFVVDLEGPYLIHLVVDAGLVTESEQYVRLRYLTENNSLKLIAAGESYGGAVNIPVDAATTGWADEQNFNLQALNSAVDACLQSSNNLSDLESLEDTKTNLNYTAAEVGFTPEVGADWTPDPTEVAGALDQLAERVAGVEPLVASALQSGNNLDDLDDVEAAKTNLAYIGSEVGYTPEDASDWTPDPTEVGGALDQLAARMTDVEEVSGGALQASNNLSDLGDVDEAKSNLGYTADEVGYTPGVSGDWTNPDPTQLSGAADQLASRVTVLEAGGSSTSPYDWADPAFAQAGDELSGFTLLNWPDATAVGAATACTTSLLEGGRILRVDHGDPASGPRVQGRLRSVAAGDWIYAMRFGVTRVNNDGTLVLSSVAPQFIMGGVCFLDGAATTAAHVGMALVMEVANPEVSGSRWYKVQGTIVGGGWPTYTVATSIAANLMSQPMDVIFQRSGTTLYYWMCVARQTPIYFGNVTVTAGAGMIGTRFQNLAGSEQLRIHLYAFRKLAALPF